LLWLRQQHQKQMAQHRVLAEEPEWSASHLPRVPAQ